MVEGDLKALAAATEPYTLSDQMGTKLYVRVWPKRTSYSEARRLCSDLRFNLLFGE